MLREISKGGIRKNKFKDKERQRNREEQSVLAVKKERK